MRFKDALFVTKVMISPVDTPVPMIGYQKEHANRNRVFASKKKRGASFEEQDSTADQEFHYERAAQAVSARVTTVGLFVG